MKKYLHRLIVLALIGASVLVFAVCIREKNDGMLRVYFLDIGQGDSIYVRSPNGHDMLVDGGPSNIVLRRLSEVMPWYDKTIDVVVETHPDADHIGGLVSILRRFHVGVFLEPGIKSKNTIDDELAKLRKEKDVDDILARRGMSIDLGGGAYFKILFPDKDVSNFKETNDASIVGQVVYGSTTVMLTGDSPKKIEKYLTTLDGAKLKSDILKAGHHGSKNSSGLPYVKVVAPEIAIFSVGKDNRYGHPSREAQDVFKSLGIPTLRTDEMGTIGFQSDGREFKRIR